MYICIVCTDILYVHEAAMHHAMQYMQCMQCMQCSMHHVVLIIVGWWLVVPIVGGGYCRWWWVGEIQMAGFCRSSPSMGKLPGLMTYCNAPLPQTLIIIIIFTFITFIHSYIHESIHSAGYCHQSWPTPLHEWIPNSHSRQATDKGGRGKVIDKESKLSAKLL